MYLDDQTVRDEAISYILQVDDAICDRTFQSDQISLDPKNRTEPRTGYHPHGPTMIQIGDWALLVDHTTRNSIIGQKPRRFIQQAQGPIDLPKQQQAPFLADVAALEIGENLSPFAT